jgi:hypothetical protein
MNVLQIKAAIAEQGSTRVLLSPEQVEELESLGFVTRDVGFTTDSNGKRPCVVSHPSEGS